MNKPLWLVTIIVVGLFSTTVITIGYGSIPPPLSFPPRYQDPEDPNNMTKTCENLAEQDAKGMGILPMDYLACFDYLDNATLIRNGFDPADKEVSLEERDTPPQDIQSYEPTTGPIAPVAPESGDDDNGDDDNGDE